MTSRYPPLHYHDYLELDQLLSAQHPRSEQYGPLAHDEMLFIVVHQTYELWFKQMLHELHSVIKILDQNHVAEKDMGLVVHRLLRLTEIQKLLTDQIHVLETMTPLDFLDFRDFLFPASGFQSFQFRQLETLIGLSQKQRLAFNSNPYFQALKPDQAQVMQDLEKGPTLFSSVQKWLERTPFLKITDFDFWPTYAHSITTMLAHDRHIVHTNQALTAADRERNLHLLNQAEHSFQSLIDPQEYKKAFHQGSWRMSLPALQGALFIQLYRDQPVLQLPFRLLTALTDWDELLTNWRYRHALMAKRMLGTKIGTGGSSGYDYLKQATEQHRVFQDFTQLTTFLIPRSRIPPLSSQMEKQLGFYYSAHHLTEPHRQGN